MVRFLLFCCMTVLLVMLPGKNMAGAGQKRETPNLAPHTVQDFFLLLPQRYFEGNTSAERLRWLKLPQSIVDIPNGYLFMQGDGAQQSLTMCLFKRPDKTYLIAVCDNNREIFESYLDFYEYVHGKLVKVTRPVLPVRYDSNQDYILPRYGTTIQVFKGKKSENDKEGKMLYEITWNRGKFSIR